MRKSSIILMAALALGLSACKSNSAPAEQKAMARAVPERLDDFVFENNFIAGRLYGKALEGNPTSPGVDIWVKMPGALVADKWYAEAQKDPEFYHHNHGEGKDCYKVAVSLGGGASAPVVEGALCMPETNYRECEVLEQTPDKVVFVLRYPEWGAGDVRVSLEKKFTLCADSYFCKVEDTYSFSAADSLTIAAGIFRHPEQETIEKELTGSDRYAIWEKASDQSVESEDGMLGVGVYVPGAESVSVTEDGLHGICTRKITSGEVFTYYFGSCWSKADIKTAEDWFATVTNLTNE